MSNRKRKSQETTQLSISKFFKNIDNKSDKNTFKKQRTNQLTRSLSDKVDNMREINVEESTDREVNKNNKKTATSSCDLTKLFSDSENKLPDRNPDGSLERRVFQSIQKSIHKLRNFDIHEATILKSVSHNSRNTTCRGNNSLVVAEYHKNKSKLDKPASFTPLEQQFVAIKTKHPDVLLFVECGYKYRFFGEDAEIAAKELNIYCHLNHNFMSASIPVHRLKVHLSRLVEKGYKVGVVNQTETAALKTSGDNKSALFTRELKQIYTRATFIDKEDCDDSSVNTGRYVAAVNTQKQNGEIVTAVLFINPTTGDIVYETYEKDNLNFGLETIFHVLKPSEVILQKSDNSSRVQNFVESYKKTFCEQIRVEYFAESSINTSLVENFEMELVNTHFKFQFHCLKLCLKMLIFYLEEFSLHSILFSCNNYRSFTSHACMKLNSSAIRNLELFENNVDKQVKGSVFWVLDHTATIFGKRLLKNWLAKPLLDIKSINERLDAISELRKNLQLESIASVKRELHWTVDLEKSLTAIYYKKLTPQQFLRTIKNLQKLSKLLSNYTSEVKKNFTSELILDIFYSVPSLLDSKLADVLSALDENETSAGNKRLMFKDTTCYPLLHACHENIFKIEQDFNEHLRKSIRPTLKNWSLMYKTVSNMEYLIEVKNSDLKSVPKEWIKVSVTKQVSRFRSLTSDKKYRELCRAREELDIAANHVWINFLDTFLLNYQDFRVAIQKIAVIDCLISLAIVSNNPGYCNPEFYTKDSTLQIINGRHPVIDILNEKHQYVANDTHLSSNEKVMVISGPNMGGKSSYIRQIAVICILAQVGSYVPAESARLPLIDSVHTRMGGTDDINRGKSTFLIELEETSLIMKEATDSSLVILDELGRGTSTHDGTSIAYSTLKYFTEVVKPYLLFVTHYPLLTKLENFTNGYVKNFHMAFMDAELDQHQENDIVESIVFLYKLMHGAAERSYGLNVARLAGIKHFILQKALEKSREIENGVENRERSIRTLRNILNEERNSTEKLWQLNKQKNVRAT